MAVASGEEKLSLKGKKNKWEKKNIWECGWRFREEERD